MILINLLPHREERRQRRKVTFFIGLALAGAAGVLAVGFWFFVLQQLIESQQARNTLLGTEIAKLETKIKDIATLRAEIDALKARQKAVEDLQVDRNVPVHVLNELVKRTPEGIYFSSVKQEGAVLTLVGFAQTNERVSELLRNTSGSSEWLTRPELVEIKVGSGQAGARDAKRLFEFSMRLSIKPPQENEPKPVAGAASAAAPTKS